MHYLSQGYAKPENDYLQTFVYSFQFNSSGKRKKKLLL